MTYFMQDNYSVYDSLPCSVAVFLINENYDIIYSNSVYNETFDSQYIKINDDDRQMFDNMLLDADTPKSLYFKSRGAHGNVLSVRAFVMKISPDKAFVLMIDDSEHIETIKKLDTACALYATAISGTDEKFFEYNKNKDTMTIFFAGRNGKIKTLKTDNFIKGIAQYKYIFEEDRNKIKHLVDNVSEEKKIDVRMKFHDSNEYEWFRIILRPDKRENVFIGSANNINERKLEEEKLKEKALIDPLSKVYNRAAAIEKIERRLKKISKDKEVALMVLDIDNFKNINDTYGHLYGDAVIAMAAGSIKSVVDKEDVVGRFGGDEFFVYIDNAEKESLENKLESIRDAILKLRFDQKNEKDISCSIGVAIGREGAEYEELFRQADSALYSAKKNGKNRFEYFSGEYFDDAALSYARQNDENESNAAQNIIGTALEIAAKSTNAENAIFNIMRHIGMALDLDCIQILKFDTMEDIVYLELQWWRERDGAYNVIISDAKLGYYKHNDLVLFKQRFGREKIFQYTPDFKEGFSVKFQDVFDNLSHVSLLYSSSTETEPVFYVISYQSWNKDRIWSKSEFNDMSEITKILSMYLKSAYIITDREKTLLHRVDYDAHGLYNIAKYFDEAGRIRRAANENKQRMVVMQCDIGNFHQFNNVYGRKEGDRILIEFSKYLLQGDKNTIISHHPGYTDRFTSLFRSSKSDEELCVIIEEKMKEFCEMMGEHQEFPLVIKVGLCSYAPEESLPNAMDTALNIKKGMPNDRCMCIFADKNSKIKLN